MKNHIKAIGLQFAFYATWLIFGFISFFMMNPNGTIKPFAFFIAVIGSILFTIIFITINYIITIKACEFVAPLATSSFRKYVFAFLAYIGFFSVIQAFLPIPIPTPDELAILAKYQMFTLIACILLFVISVISYNIFNKKSGE